VAVKIKLKRLGKIRAPYYRIVVADARTKRDGRAIEEIGKYHPKADPSFIEVDSERAQHWLSVGAQPTDPVRKLLEITGDWQKFKGLPGTEGTLRVAEPKADRKVAFAAALQETLDAGDSTSKAKIRTKAGDGAPAKAGRSARPEKSDKASKPAPAKADAEATPADAAAATAPAATEPASAAPAAAEPAATEPAATEPAATEPAAAAPAATEPAATEPAGESASSEG
jgi:small subunit ribosomal protein S16